MSQPEQTMERPAPEQGAGRQKHSTAPAVAWALTGTLLFTVMIVLVNVVSFRRYARWDFTREGLYTLSDRTEQLLAALDRPVEIYLFMSSGEPNFQDMKELITRYRAKSPKIVAHFVDPDREPSRFRLLAERFGVRAGMTETGQTEADLAALVMSGDKRWSITRDDLVNIDVESLDQGERNAPKVDVKSEQALSGAIVQVTSGRATKVCVTRGHGEWTLDGEGRSLLAMKDALKRENVEVEAIETRGKSELPKACDAVFVLGPEKAFASEESGLLKSYLDGGGNLLLALDPVLDGETVTGSGLESLVAAYGIKLEADVLVELDPERLLSPNPVEAVVVTSFGDHPLAKPLRTLGAPVVMQLARTLTLSENGEASWLMRASDKAYGETTVSQLTAGDDLVPSDGDIKAPVDLAAVVETRKKEGDAKKTFGGRLVVIGDSDWLSPELLQQPQVANIDLLSSSAGFLTQREALISIAPRKLSARSVLITEDGLLGVFVRAVVLMPLSALILGVGVWWQRRS